MGRQETGHEVMASVVKEVLEQRRRRDEIRAEIWRLGAQAYEERSKTNMELLHTLAEQAGVDLAPLLEEERRRRIARRYKLEDGYAEIRAKAGALAREQVERRREIRDKFPERFEMDVQAKEGNPYLRFYESVPQWCGTYTKENVPEATLINERDRYEAAYWEASSDINPGYHPDRWGQHLLYCSAYCRTGVDDQYVHMQIYHDLWLQREGLEPGRGGFTVDFVWVGLQGEGHSEGNQGHFCIGDPGGFWENLVEMKYSVTLWRPKGDMGIPFGLLKDVCIYGTNVDHNNDINIDERPKTRNCTRRIEDGDEMAGTDLYVHFGLETYVAAYRRESTVILDVSQGCIYNRPHVTPRDPPPYPPTFGLSLSTVSVHGEYDE